MFTTNASFISTASVSIINSDKYVLRFSLSVVEAGTKCPSLLYAKTYNDSASLLSPNIDSLLLVVAS